jgi:type 1 glutamine amidotransferase
MKNFTILSALVLLSSGLPAVSAQTAPAPGATPKASPATKAYTTPPAAIAPIPAADLASIKAALPEKASAEPKKPRKVLLFYRAEGFVHPSIPYGVEALKELGEKTGAYVGVASDDMAMFDPSTLNQFDAVAFINSTQLKFENPVHRKALLDFVASGKGVVGIHAASDNFPKWNEGQELMGGLFHGHPWHAGDLVAVKLDDPSHPLNKGFNNQGFRLKEEIYQIVAPYGRDKQRELVSLDMSKPENQRTSAKDKAGNPVLVRTDNDFPISWIKKEGEGRVFYTSLGHNKDIYFVPQILRHYLDGIQYALGDLAADDLPTASLKALPAPALAPEGTTETLQKVRSAPEPPKAKPVGAPAAKSAMLVPLHSHGVSARCALPAGKQKTEAPVANPGEVLAAGQAAIGSLSKYNYGDATDSLFAVSEALRKGTAETRKDFGTKFLAILQDPSATPASKQTICRWLGWMGGEDAVPVLAKLAASAPYDSRKVEEATPGYAIRALATIPVPSADKALVDLLGSGGDQRSLAVMSAVGIRGVVSAIPGLSRIAAVPSPALCGAALETLASLRSTEALEAILKAGVNPANEALRDQAVINASSSLLKKPGETLPEEAVKKLASIAAAEGADAQRLSAVRVLMSANQPAGLETAVRFLESEDYRLRTVAAETLAEYATADQLKALAWASHPEGQVILLGRLAQKGDASFLPLGLQALGDKDPKVRVVALGVVTRCGTGAGNLDALLPLLTDADASVAAAAKASVASLKGEEAGSKMVALIQSSKPQLAAILLSVLSSRQDHKAFDVAVKATASPDRALQSAGWEALSGVAAAGDLDKCLALVGNVKGRDVDNFQKALVRTAIYDPSPAQAAVRISQAFDRAGIPQKEILINVLALLEAKEASDKVKTILQSPDVELRKQAIRALSSARSELSLKLLPDVAANGATNSEKILALRGFIDAIEQLNANDYGKKTHLYLIAWKAATRDEEKGAIRAAVKKIPVNEYPATPEAQQLLKEVNAQSPKITQ